VQHISTIYARFICRELQLSPAEVDALLANSSLSHSDLASSATMPYLDFFEFLNSVIATNPAPDLGLKVGAQLAPPSLGVYAQPDGSSPAGQGRCFTGRLALVEYS